MYIPKSKDPDTQAEIEMKNKAYQDWLNRDMPDSDSNYERAKKALPKVMEKLTEKQRLYFTEWIVEGLTMEEIGERHGRDKSVVSRTIRRARKTLYDYMSIVSPEYASELNQFPQRVIKYNKRRNGQ